MNRNDIISQYTGNGITKLNMQPRIYHANIGTGIFDISAWEHLCCLYERCRDIYWKKINKRICIHTCTRIYNYNYTMYTHIIHSMWDILEMLESYVRSRLGLRQSQCCFFRWEENNIFRGKSAWGRIDVSFLQHESRPVQILRSIVWVGVTRLVECILHYLG